MFKSQSKEVQAAQSTRQTLAWHPPGLRIQLWPDFCLYVDLRFIALSLLFTILYFLAGEIAGEWIYLIAAGTLTLICLGIAIPFLQVLDTKASIQIPGEGQAEERFSIELEISHALFTGLWGNLLPLRWLRFTTTLLKNDKFKAKGFIDPCAFVFVGKKASVATLSEPLKRGLYQFDSLVASSCFPFSVVWWSRKIPSKILQKSLMRTTGTLTVYPQLVPIKGLFLQSLGSGGETIGQLRERNRASQASCAVRGLRDYRMGDSPRWVHWPSTARTHRLMVKEFESESSSQYFIALDTGAAWSCDDQFELAVCLANSIVHFEAPRSKFELLIPPSDELKDVYAMPLGLARSREILARVQSTHLAPFGTTRDSEIGEETSLKRIEQIFAKTLRSHPGAVLFAILPGSRSNMVNLLETTLDMRGRPQRQQGPSQRHHVLSPERLTGQHKPLIAQDQTSFARGKIIAYISQPDEIASL